MKIYKLCLYGDVKLFKQLSSDLDIDALISEYERAIEYFLYKGAYFSMFVLDLLTKYANINFYINNNTYKELYNKL